MVHTEIADCPVPMLVVADLHGAFQKSILLLRSQMAPPGLAGIHPSANIADTAHIGSTSAVAAGVGIGEQCVIGERCVLHAGVQLMDGCVVGDDCELFPNVTLYRHTRLGNRVLIHAGAVLGAYGFGYRPQAGQHMRTAQLGWVEIEDDVEIGAGTTIDRGTYGPTRIGTGTKIDNQVQIAHNCHIGPHNLICAQVGIAGSTSTGHHVVMAGQVGVADHLQLPDNVTVGAQAGVMNNLQPGMVAFGSPAGPRRERMLELACIQRLPEMRSELKSLQAQVAKLTEQLALAVQGSVEQRRSA
jgi:UDP-3-O-[3-hydroxymyristoyl] glucosamine N-acyltransferase